MKKCKLGEISNVTKLAGFEHTKYIQGNCTRTKNQDDDVPLFIGRTVRDGKIDENFDWYIPKAISEGLERSKLYKKCLVLPYVGSVGDLAIFEGGYFAHLGSNIAKIELVDNCGYIEEFIYYYLKSPHGQQILLKDIQGAVQKNITMEAIRNVELPVVSLEEQIRQVGILKTIDDKIDKNHKTNNILESMARTIYDYWFLQFDFPDENGRPYKSYGGKMVWNEELKREIPCEWSIDSIVDLCEIVDCLHSKKPEYKYEKEDCYLLSLENLSKEGYIDISKKYYISVSDYEEWTKKITVLENDFIVTNAGRAGDIGRIPKGIKCAIGRNMTAIRPVSISPYYLRQFFKSNYVTEQIMNNLDCGSFFKSFNVKSIRKLKVIVPNESVMNDFLLKVESLILKIDAINEENRELTSLRDFLLPLLMNGQVGFKEC